MFFLVLSHGVFYFPPSQADAREPELVGMTAIMEKF